MTGRIAAAVALVLFGAGAGCSHSPARPRPPSPDAAVPDGDLWMCDCDCPDPVDPRSVFTVPLEGCGGFGQDRATVCAHACYVRRGPCLGYAKCAINGGCQATPGGAGRIVAPRACRVEDDLVSGSERGSYHVTVDAGRSTLNIEAGDLMPIRQRYLQIDSEGCASGRQRRYWEAMAWSPESGSMTKTARCLLSHRKSRFADASKAMLYVWSEIGTRPLPVLGPAMMRRSPLLRFTSITSEPGGLLVLDSTNARSLAGSTRTSQGCPMAGPLPTSLPDWAVETTLRSPVVRSIASRPGKAVYSVTRTRLWAESSAKPRG